MSIPLWKKKELFSVNVLTVYLKFEEVAKISRNLQLSEAFLTPEVYLQGWRFLTQLSRKIPLIGTTFRIAANFHKRGLRVLTLYPQNVHWGGCIRYVTLCQIQFKTN